MTWLIVTAIVLLLFAPLRRVAFGRHTIAFTIAALVGAALGLVYAQRAQTYGLNFPCLTWLLVLFGAGVIGLSVKSAVDQVFRHGGDK